MAGARWPARRVRKLQPNRAGDVSNGYASIAQRFAAARDRRNIGQYPRSRHRHARRANRSSGHARRHPTTGRRDDQSHQRLYPVWQRHDDGDDNQSKQHAVGELVSRSAFASHQFNALTNAWHTPTRQQADDDDFAYFRASWHTRHSHSHERRTAPIYRHHLSSTLT